MAVSRALVTTITRIAPLFECLGHYRVRGGMPRYVLRVRGEVRVFRAIEMHGLAFLLDLYPDHEHWRRLFPLSGSRKVDTKAALSWFIRECAAAGEYQAKISPELDTHRHA